MYSHTCLWYIYIYTFLGGTVAGALVVSCDIHTCTHILVGGTCTHICKGVSNTAPALEETVASAGVVQSHTHICIHILVGGAYLEIRKEQS